MNNCRPLNIIGISMRSPSLSDSDTNQKYPTLLPDDQDLSSEGSTNHAARHMLSTSLKNQKPKVKFDLFDPTPSELDKITMQDEIVPLLGSPYFTFIFTKSHVHSPYQLAVPKAFQHLLPSSSVPMALVYRDKEWWMTYTGDHRSLRRFDNWKKFCIDNNLKLGDGCVLEVMDGKDLKFRVQILSGETGTENAEAGDSSKDSLVMFD